MSAIKSILIFLFGFFIMCALGGIGVAMTQGFGVGTLQKIFGGIICIGGVLFGFGIMMHPFNKAEQEEMRRFTINDGHSITLNGGIQEVSFCFFSARFYHAN